MNRREWALKVLGLEQGTGETEIREAYRDLVSVWHPDKHAHNERVRLRAERMVKRLNTARDILLGTGDGAAWTEDDEFEIDDETPPEEEVPPEEPENGEDYETEPAATEPEMRSRSDLYGAAGMSVVVTAMLAWAVWGKPPYAFFGVMKWAVASTCAYWAVLLWMRTRALAPVCLVLLVAGGLHAFGEMRKDEWVPVNVVTGGFLLLISLAGLWPVAGRRLRWLLLAVVFGICGAYGAVALNESLGSRYAWVWESRFWANPAPPPGASTSGASVTTAALSGTVEDDWTRLVHFPDIGTLSVKVTMGYDDDEGLLTLRAGTPYNKRLHERIKTVPGGSVILEITLVDEHGAGGPGFYALAKDFTHDWNVSWNGGGRSQTASESGVKTSARAEDTLYWEATAEVDSATYLSRKRALVTAGADGLIVTEGD